MANHIKKILLAIFIILTVKMVSGQEKNSLNREDSILVLKKVYMYDFEQNKFNDLDEPYIEDLWLSDKQKAKKLFEKAIKLDSAPVYEKMILASYFYHDNDLKQVEYVIKACKNKSDTVNVFRVMDSYKIKFSDLNISRKLLELYCSDCQYE